MKKATLLWIIIMIVTAALASGEETRNVSIFVGWNAGTPEGKGADAWPYTGPEAGLSFLLNDGPKSDFLFVARYERDYPAPNTLWNQENVRNRVCLGPEVMWNDVPIGIAGGIVWGLMEGTADGSVNQYGVWFDMFAYTYPIQNNCWFRIDPYLGMKIVGGFEMAIGVRFCVLPF